MINANPENLKLVVCDNVKDEDELERQRIKRIRESNFAKDLPALQLAYELAKLEPAQPRMYGLTKVERVLFGLPVDN
jgi:hypothetical protein